MTVGEAFKQVIPAPVLRRLRMAHVFHNQQHILKSSIKYKPILLEPDNNVEHYYHFLFDLALPLWRLTRSERVEHCYCVKHFGPFAARLSQLFPDSVSVLEAAADTSSLRSRALVGMNPRHVHLTPEAVAAFKEYVCSTLSIRRVDIPTRVVLIERLPPDSYFTTTAVKRGAGASRRSIQNHDEVAAALKASVEPPHEFCNVQLETMDWREQIELFDSAALVIGQHGAGLANCLWMRPGTSVIEITHDESLPHFRILSRLVGASHESFQTAGPHARVCPQQLLRRVDTVASNVGVAT